MATRPERAPGMPPPLPKQEAVVGEEVSGLRELPKAPDAQRAETSGETDFFNHLDEIGFSEEAKAGARILPPKERGFVSQLFERLQSAEVVQNIGDRYQVWRDSRIAERTDRNIGTLEERRKAAEEERHALLEQGKGAEKEVETVAGTLKELGIELGEAELASVKKEASLFAEKAAEAQAKAEELEGRKRDLTEKKEGYEARVGAARGRLDSRLEAKQEINNQSLDTFRGQVTEFDSQLKTNRDRVTELSGKAEKVRAIMGAVKLETLKDLMKAQLVLIEKDLARLDKPTKQLEANRKKTEGKIAALEKKNKDLQGRREGIFPAKEKTLEKPTEGAKGKVYAIDSWIAGDGSPVLEYPDGTRRGLHRDGVVTMSAEGLESVEPFDQLTDDDFEEFFADGWSAEELQKEGTAPEVIERIERIREAKAQSAGETVSGWNGFVRRELGAKSGLALAVEGDPNRQFASRNEQREYLKNQLAKKAARGNVGMLSHRTIGLIERFLDSRAQK